MERNVMSWNVAIENGYNPSLYSYNASNIPLGEYKARLDFKIWAKKVMGISCYFVHEETGNKFQLTIYRQPATKEYTLDSGGISFDDSPVGCMYQLKVTRNDKGRIIFEKAQVLE